MNTIQEHHVILTGDSNCPNIDWEHLSVLPGAAEKEVQQALIDLALDFGLHQIHDQPTRQDNMLDLVFTNNPSLVKNSNSTPGISDHAMVVTDFEVLPHIVKHNRRRCYMFQKANWSGIKHATAELSSLVQTRVENKEDIEDVWSFFKSSLFKILDDNVPSKIMKGRKSLPWFSHSLKRMVRRKMRLYKKAKKTQNQERKKNAWKQYTEFQKTCKRSFKEAEENFILSSVLHGLEENNSKPFWRYVSSKRRDRTGIPALKQAGNLIHDGRLKAQLLLHQFKSVFSHQAFTPPDEPSAYRSRKIQDLHITIAGVEKLLSKININKAAGPDCIPNTVLKECAAELAPGLTAIFRLSLSSGSLPSDWRDALISPVFKKGDIHQPCNYRPVSLTSVICKQLEHIICRHILKHLEGNNILSSLNHGFRSGHSTETQLLTVTHDLLLSHDKKTQTDVIILDFEKAFDTVPHSLLLHKLHLYGIEGPIHQWLTSFLTKRQMKVVVEGELSSSAAVTSGVPQGTVLGPLLFLCHINDLPDVVKSQVRLFADDCVLYRQIRSQRDHVKLQDDLSKLHDWACTWGMRFNATKCQVMSIDQKSSHFYNIDGHILKHTPQEKYLGVTLSDDLKWSPHINNTTKKASAVLGLLRRNLQFCPEQCKRTAYIALTRSILEYGACVWDPYLQKDIDNLERVQRRALRFITGDYTSRDPGSITSMRQRLNLPTLASRRQVLKLSSFFKAVEGLVPGLPIESFLTRARPRRNIKIKQFENYKTHNILERQVINHEKGFKIHHCNTEQYKHSFFVSTPLAWNHLPPAVANSSSPEVFRSRIEQSHHHYD